MTGSAPDGTDGRPAGGSRLYWSAVETPIGPMTVTGDQNTISSLYLNGQRHRPPADVTLVRDDARLCHIADELGEYFAGQRTVFDLCVRVRWGTAFQRAVWEQLTRIPFGATTSYGEIAARLGSPGASRAVGLANGRNPVSIIVPCHRVVGADGSLTGYGGGLERKRWLLEHERGIVELGSAVSSAAAAGYVQPRLVDAEDEPSGPELRDHRH